MPSRKAKHIPVPDARADFRQDHLYLLGRGRLLHAFHAFRASAPIRRFAAQIVISLTDEPIRLTVEGRKDTYHAVAIKPRASRICVMQHGLGFQLAPWHPVFRRFRGIDASGALGYERELFRPFDTDFEAAFRGELPADQAASLFDQVLDIIVDHLPKPEPLDPRISKVVELLNRDPRYPLQKLAATVGLSYFRLSHLFADEIGIPIRSYQVWRKVYAAARLLPQMSITEAARQAGFTDPAHLSRAFERLHAESPSYYMNSRYVNVISSRGAKLETRRG